MKKWLTLSTALLTLLLFSCKDDNTIYEPPANYEDKLAGTWNLDKVIYDTEIPDLTGGSGTIPINGEGSEVDGTIVLSQNPNKFTYDFTFSASLMGLTVPVNQAGEGTWTTTRDDSKIIVTDNTGEEIIFNVMVNEAKKQVYTTTISQNVLNAITIEVDLHLEFSRP